MLMTLDCKKCEEDVKRIDKAFEKYRWKRIDMMKMYLLFASVK